MQDMWYHNAIIYSLDVETYKDSNADGIGDFAGLISKLDHLYGLGINCIWLRPFFASPLVDDGYDIKDYYSVDPRLGNLGDFVDFTVKAKALGIKVIIDLVVNHTSDQHFWFQEARNNKESKYRNYYIWRDKEPTKDEQKGNILNFDNVWEYDQQAGAYYMHHYHKEQPDLNISNPDVKAEIFKIMGFWLKLGISGFRIDSAHTLVNESKGKVVELLEEMREFLSNRNHEAILLGEANVEVDQLQSFFFDGGRKKLHLLFNFITNKNIFLAFTRKSAEPLLKSLKEIKKIKGKWVNFLRHHDELNLEMLTEEERNEVFEEFAPEQEMRLFGHGIRRRLPPMFKGNRKMMELVYTILFSLPGIPLINYGEEIAMGEDLSEEGRASVRTAMQWDDTKNAGFSLATEDSLVHPVIDFGQYDYRKVNVSMQQKDPDSFLNWMEHLISNRKQSPQIGFGVCEMLNNDLQSVLSFFNEWESMVVVFLFNLKDEQINVKLDPGKFRFGKLIEVFNNMKYDEIVDIESEIQLSPYGYRWFKGKIEQK